MALVFFGIYSYFSMGIGIVPNISFPGVAITTTEAGADPASIETQVTKPIEDAVSTLSNVDTIQSTSSEGVSSVFVQFTTAANSTLVPVDVERVLNSLRSQLPADADPPTISTIDTSAFPVLSASLSGTQPIDQLQQVAVDRIQKGFASVPGVGSVVIAGGRDREVQIKVDLNKLQAHGLGLNTLQQALQSEQVQVPAGFLSAQTKDVNVRLNALVTTPAQLGQIIIAQTANGPVYVNDVATVDDTLKKTTVISRVNGEPAVTLTVTKLASANTIQVSEGIHQQMVKLQPSLPQGMKLDTVFDAATYTSQSFNTIKKTLGEAVLFTGIILLLFLHTWRSTFIVLVSIPTSVLTTFGVMNLMGMNLNLFSMLALTLAVGILVDDSIVVLENIYRHLNLGEPPFVAASNGRSEIGLAAITITMVDVAVYLPIALMPGIAGEFIRPFALVIAAATLTSLLVSFTLTPLLASRYLQLENALRDKAGPIHRFGLRFGETWDRGFQGLDHAYERLLHRVLIGRRGRVLVLLVGLFSFILALVPLKIGLIGQDIFPSGDQSEVDATIVMPSGTSLDQTDAVVKQMEQRLNKAFYKEVTEVQSSVGTSGSFTSTGGDTAIMRILLAPKSERTKSSDELSVEISDALGQGIPGVKVRVGLPNAFGFGGFGGGQPIQVSVKGPNPEVLNNLVDQITTAIKAVPGASDVNNANENVQPEYVIQVDRSRAADVGVTAQAAAGSLSAAVNGTLVSKFRQPGQKDVDIRLIADDAFRASPSNLASLPLLTTSGSIVSLGQIGTITPGTAPTQIAHVDRERAVTINASANGRPVGDVQNGVQAAIAKIAVPPGYAVTYGGEAQQGASAFADIFKAMGVGFVLIYMLMMLLFGSVTLPLAVMMSLPLALVGAFGAMAITETKFTLFSLLGFTLLIGLVGKNAILLVDYTATLRKRGKSRMDALLEAGPTRLRPIVMTTMSVIVALAPLAFGVEDGSELLKAAAIVLVGGLITSTLLTLVFVPTMYTIFDSIEEKFGNFIRRFSKPRQLTPIELDMIRPHPPTLIVTDADGSFAGTTPDLAGVDDSATNHSTAQTADVEA